MAITRLPGRIIDSTSNFTFGNVTTTGNLTASKVTATTLVGTLSTAAQPTVTSVGTLTSLAVSGNITVSSSIITSGVYTNSYFYANGAAYYNTGPAGATGIQGPAGTTGAVGATGAAGSGGSGGGSANIIVQDEGSTLTSALYSLNFVGAGVSATTIGSNVTVTVSSGGGSTSVTAGNINGGTSLSFAQSYNGNGTTTAFNFPGTILDATQLIVFVDGIYQTPNVNFSANTSWVIFTTAPLSSDVITIQTVSAGYTGIATPLISQQFTGDGSRTSFTLSDYVAVTDILVTVDTVIQAPTLNYTVNGLNLVFDTAPIVGSLVGVRSFGNWSARDGFVNTFTGNGVATTYTLSGNASSSRSMMVFVDGIYQVPDVDFTVAGPLLTFSGAPDSASLITIQSFNNTLGTNAIVADPAGITVANVAYMIDSFSTSLYRTAKYIVSVTNGTSYQATEAMLVHDGVIPYLVTYATVYTGSAQIMSFSANISSNSVTFYGTGVGSSNTVKLQRTYVKV